MKKTITDATLVEVGDVLEWEGGYTLTGKGLNSVCFESNGTAASLFLSLKKLQDILDAGIATLTREVKPVTVEVHSAYQLTHHANHIDLGFKSPADARDTATILAGGGTITVTPK